MGALTNVPRWVEGRGAEEVSFTPPSAGSLQFNITYGGTLLVLKLLWLRRVREADSDVTISTAGGWIPGVVCILRGVRLLFLLLKPFEFYPFCVISLSHPISSLSYLLLLSSKFGMVKPDHIFYRSAVESTTREAWFRLAFLSFSL